MAGLWKWRVVPVGSVRVGKPMCNTGLRPMAKIVPDDAVARWTMENGWWPYTPTGRFRKRYGAVVGRLECRAFLQKMTEQCFDVQHRVRTNL